MESSKRKQGGTALFYEVTGSSGKKYIVRRLDKEDWRCECKAFAFGKGQPCKHIRCAQQWFLVGFEGSYNFPCQISLNKDNKERKENKKDGMD